MLVGRRTVVQAHTSFSAGIQLRSSSPMVIAPVAPVISPVPPIKVSPVPPVLVAAPLVLAVVSPVILFPPPTFLSLALLVAIAPPPTGIVVPPAIAGLAAAGAHVSQFAVSAFAILAAGVAVPGGGSRCIAWRSCRGPYCLHRLILRRSPWRIRRRHSSPRAATLRCAVWSTAIGHSAQSYRLRRLGLSRSDGCWGQNRCGDRLSRCGENDFRRRRVSRGRGVVSHGRRRWRCWLGRFWGRVELDIVCTRSAVEVGDRRTDRVHVLLLGVEQLPPRRRGVRRQFHPEGASGEPDGGAANHLGRILHAHVGALRVVDEVPGGLR
mmetsp:Transcript_858/g.2662  ORF Transcript_858/g.2662 Transcript_858/m.2662 type:complete len:323 (+) Transcript_858:352-1320(+)